MNGIYTILLLVLSNIFMTIAWYGHLKLQQTGVSSHWPLAGVIAFSWAIAFFEYTAVRYPPTVLALSTTAAPSRWSSSR